jgi:ribosome-associated translation inhibitor RaiA
MDGAVARNLRPARPDLPRGSMISVQIRSDGRITRRDLDAARHAMAGLDHHVDRPLFGARLTVRGSGAAARYVADATVRLDGRLLAAHAVGPAPTRAAVEAAERLRRQLLRTVEAEVARRNEPRFSPTTPPGPPRPQWVQRLKAPDRRALVRRRTYIDVPLPTFDAIDELVGLRVVFFLFRHARTGEAVVLHRRDDRRLGLLFPPGSVLADEDDVVVATPSRYDAPLPLSAARAEMDLVAHRFMYFADADDGHDKVLYLRRDGDYGLVEAA